MAVITIERTIRIRDEQGNAHTIEGADFNVDDPEVNEGPMGPQRLYEAKYENDAAGFAITIQIVEYPEGAYNHHEVHVEGCSVLANQLEIVVEPDNGQPD